LHKEKNEKRIKENKPFLMKIWHQKHFENSVSDGNCVLKHLAMHFETPFP